MKKIVLLTIVFLCSITLITNSDSVQSEEADEFIYLPIISKPKSPFWSKTYPEQRYKDFAVTSDGEHLVLASDTSYGFTLAKLDADGEPVWEKTGSTYSMQPIEVTATDDGNIIITGYTSDNLWAAKFSNTGTLIWQKNYSYNQHDGDAFALIPTNNGGVAIAGYTEQDSDIDYWILNLDKNGGIIWQKTFGGDKTDVATLIKKTPDNGFIVSGYTYSFGPLSYTWVIKLNSSGNLVWQKMLQGEYSWDLINDATVAPDGSSYFSGNKTNDSGNGVVDWWVFKLDASGNLAWSKTIDITGSTDSRGGKIFALDNNNIYVSGSSYKDKWNPMLFNFDKDGNARWHKIYEHGVAIQNIDSQVITITGYFNGDFMIAKSNLSGDVIGCSAATQTDVTILNITKRIQTTNSSLSSPTISIENTAFSVTNSTFPSSQELVCGG
ncbi:MAG: hypothetical protein IAF02_10870 [Anaerolineae bacterium]|nr:hypothetical protein [Anaerolineae bacterium]